jgi:hypothetical protein
MDNWPLNLALVIETGIAVFLAYTPVVNEGLNMHGLKWVKQSNQSINGGIKLGQFFADSRGGSRQFHLPSTYSITMNCAVS